MSNLPVSYRVVLGCEGVPSDVAAQGAIDITESFLSRPWHKNVSCHWDGKYLIIQAENDFDPDGRALMDELSDAISASISDGFDGDIRVISSTKI